MGIDERTLADTFRLAELDEVTPPGERAAEYTLNQLFTNENMWKGFRLDFGQNRDDFARVVDALGLSRLLQEQQIGIQALVVSSGSTTAFIGGNREVVESVPLVDALEAMQVDQMDVAKDFGVYPRLSTRSRDGVIESRIVLGRSPERQADHEIVHADPPDDVGVMLGLVCRYLPDTGEHARSLSYMMNDIHEEDKIDTHSLVVGRLATVLATHGYGLVMPSSNYSLGVGPVAHGGGYVGIDFGVTSVRANERYVFDGRVAKHIPDQDESEF